MESEKQRRISIDPNVIDILLAGGIESDVVTTVYGPAGSGKSCIAMLAASNVVKSGKRAIYIDTEGGFSVERFKQIDPNYKEALKNVVIVKPMSFAEQEETFKNLEKMLSDKIGVIIVDSIAMLYRFEIGKCQNISGVNTSLSIQLSSLIRIARERNIPSILTNHVYADFDKPNGVKLVGGDILKYSSKCLLELKKLSGSNRVAIIRKHRSIPDGRDISFELVREGFSITGE